MGFVHRTSYSFKKVRGRTKILIDRFLAYTRSEWLALQQNITHFSYTANQLSCLNAVQNILGCDVM
jgi:hypothetical protein